MVGFIETHSEIAQGYVNTWDARVKSKQNWEKLAKKLNLLGPPERTADGWKKVVILLIHIYLYLNYF